MKNAVDVLVGEEDSVECCVNTGGVSPTYKSSVVLRCSCSEVHVGPFDAKTEVDGFILLSHDGFVVSAGVEHNQAESG